MTEGSLPETAGDEESAAFQRLFAQTAAALKRGEAPRGKLKLLQAIRLARKNGQPKDQLTGLRLLAEVEERAGNHDEALKRAASAVRLAQNLKQAEDLVESHLILARVHSNGGRHEVALEQARRAAHHAEQVNAERQWDTLSRLAITALQANQPAEALEVAGKAADLAPSLDRDGIRSYALRSEWVWAELLLRVGLASAAEGVSHKALRAADDSPWEVELTFTRGAARLALGAGDRALRDFRRIGKVAKSNGDASLEAEALAAQGVARAVTTRPGDSGHLDDQNGDGKGSPSSVLLARAERRARRLKLPAVIANVSGWTSLANGGGNHGPDRVAVANRLVQLAKETELEAVVDACMQEVQRLSSLPPEVPAYAVNPEALPLRLPR